MKAFNCKGKYICKHFYHYSFYLILKNYTNLHFALFAYTIHCHFLSFCHDFAYIRFILLF